MLGLYLLRQRVVLPVRRVSEAARRVGEGDLGVRVSSVGEGEVALLAASFNEMTQQLESRSEALEKAVVELRETNAQLRTARDGLDRAERLAAVGSLAAGVAHEVGNPMGALLAYLGMARKDAGLSQDGDLYLQKASDQGERVREILRQLLDFSRPPRALRHPVDLVRACGQAVDLARTQRRYDDVDFGIDSAPALPHVQGDESILAQILLNLVVNAADATEGQPERQVRIAFETLPLALRIGESRQQAALHRGIGDGVACRIEDSGGGVAPEDRERIFDPFFTTQAPGEGTGLGLANAQRLAEELGGVLEVEDSARLGGACFVLILPDARAAMPAREAG